MNASQRMEEYLNKSKAFIHSTILGLGISCVPEEDKQMEVDGRVGTE